MTSMTLIWLLSGLVFTGTVLSTILGLLNRRSKNPQAIVRNHILSRAAALFAVYVGLVELVPRCKALFLGFGTELPSISVWLIQCSDMVVRMPVRVAVDVLMVLAAETFVVRNWSRSEETQQRAKLWSVSITLVILVGLLLGLIALVMPLIKLLNDLS